MNKVEKLGNGGYQLVCEDGSIYPCERWYEKSSGCFHVRLPKDNPSGRQYIRESFFETRDVVEFETKTAHRVLGPQSASPATPKVDWKSLLTDEESDIVAEHEAVIKTYFDKAMSRKSMSDLELKIKELTEQLENMKK